MNLFSFVKSRVAKAPLKGAGRFAGEALPSAVELQFCKMLSQGSAARDAANQPAAMARLQQAMALIPSGEALLEPISLSDSPMAGLEHVAVPAFYIDRFTVTNAEYAAFVASGIYDDMALWPSEVWQHVLQFVDRSGVPGPQSWVEGRPPRDQMNFPVTGICWYEAMAYAKWVGKSLPTAAQWQRSASWHTGQNGQQEALSYPWGNAFDATKSNIWSSGVGRPVAVDKYYNGCTPNGVHQLIGNVWEWLDQPFVIPWNDNHLLGGYAEVRGGAFDTYFESQCRCQFRSGQPLLFRGTNVGFRCCIQRRDLSDAPELQTPPPSDN